MSGPDDELDESAAEPEVASADVRAHSDALDAWIDGDGPAPLEGPAAAMAQVRAELRAAGPAPGEVDDLVASVLGSLAGSDDRDRPGGTDEAPPGASHHGAGAPRLARVVAAAAAVLLVVALGAVAVLRPTGEENAGEAATTEGAAEESPDSADSDTATTGAPDGSGAAEGLQPDEQTAEAAPAMPGESEADAFAAPESDSRDDTSVATSPFAGLRVVLVVPIP